MADLTLKVHDHTTQVFLNGFCLFLPRHLVVSVGLLGAHCGRPLVAHSHVINETTAQYHYPATVRMSCDDGYERADGSYALRCLANGQWNDTSVHCKRKWSSGVQYTLGRFCVCLFLDKTFSITHSSSCCKLFSFFTCWDEMSLTRGTCAWSPAGFQRHTHTPFWMAPKEISDQNTQASHNLQFILQRWTSLGVKGQLLRLSACTDTKRSLLRGHAGTTQVDFEVDGQILHREIINFDHQGKGNGKNVLKKRNKHGTCSYLWLIR